MKKTFFYLLIFSQVFGQSIIDTLSVTVYPEFSYPGVAIEYKFDKSNNNDITFPIPANIDSVLYTISTDSLEFEKIVQVENNLLKTLNQNGNHTIYLFLDKFIKDPGPRRFSYNFESLQDINTLILGVQIPFGSEEFQISADSFNLEKVRDQNGLTFYQGINNNFSDKDNSLINLNYYNPHGGTSIQYAANISTQDSSVQPPPSANDKFVRYPLLTWEPMLMFLFLSLFIVFIYEFQRSKND
tara:strand:+ start:1405 stop:2130 length:726 start_codon:yes stop_codon:yes gene_type:complete